MNYLLDTCVVSDFFKKIPLVVNILKPSLQKEFMFLLLL